MRRPPGPSAAHNSTIPDLLWISKQQQQHPSIYAHPLKNTVRVSSNGIRHKFDGKQWRPLCQSPDAYECRNVAFRSSLCQKHFYKVNLIKRPYTKSRSTPSHLPLKRALPADYEHQHVRAELDEICQDDNDDSIEVIEDTDVSVRRKAKRHLACLL